MECEGRFEADEVMGDKEELKFLGDTDEEVVIILNDIVPVGRATRRERRTARTVGNSGGESGDVHMKDEEA